MRREFRGRAPRPVGVGTYGVRCGVACDISTCQSQAEVYETDAANERIKRAAAEEEQKQYKKELTVLEERCKRLSIELGTVKEEHGHTKDELQEHKRSQEEVEKELRLTKQQIETLRSRVDEKLAAKESFVGPDSASVHH